MRCQHQRYRRRSRRRRRRRRPRHRLRRARCRCRSRRRFGGLVVVQLPFTSSIRTVSLPLPASTSIARKVLRSNVWSAEPSLPTSTWSWFRSRALRRSVICSANGPPEMRNVPSTTPALRVGAAEATGIVVAAAMAVSATASGNFFQIASLPDLASSSVRWPELAGIGKTEHRPYVGMVETGFNAAHFGRGNRGPVRWPSSRIERPRRQSDRAVDRRGPRPSGRRWPQRTRSSRRVAMRSLGKAKVLLGVTAEALSRLPLLR